jgi:molecular chaperone DnaK
MTTVGFDFGTTNSVMSIVVGDRCIPILEDGFPHPSVVSYRGGVPTVGRRAKSELESAGSGVMGNIVRSPKTMLGRSSVTVDGHTYSPQVVVRDVVAHVMAHARGDRVAKQTGSSFDRAVVTIPVDMNGERRRELREACRMAGLSVYQFVHEPLAALYGHFRGMPDYRLEFSRLNRQLVLVFDWGGGTLDLTLCRVSEGMLVQVANDGCSEVGGDTLDDMLVNEIERRVLESRGIRHSVGRQVGALSGLRSAAERAKIALSEKDVHPLLVPDYFMPEAGDVDLEFRLSRTDLEAIVASKVSQGIGRIEKLLLNARVDPSGVAMCLATGGMVNMPLIQARLRELFGAGRVEVSSRGNTIISEGAAWIANDGARLVLAKNIEVLVARQAYFPVVPAGSLMPRESEAHRPPVPLTLYCSDPTDGIAKFVLTTPKRTGRSVQVNDERDILGTLAVSVDSNQRPLLERLLLDVTIDENLVLRTKGTSTIAGATDEA